MRVHGPEDELHPVQVEIFRRMSPAQRLAVAMSLTRSLVEGNLKYLRSLHPEWTELDLRREWTALNYGRELAERAYGPG